MRLGDKIVLGVGLIVIIILLTSCGSLHPDQRYRNDWNNLKKISDAIEPQKDFY